MTKPVVVEYYENGNTILLTPTTVRGLGKNEQFFEELIEKCPELLELESISTGIQKPFKIFRQNMFINAIERTIIPDITIFSASGHVIIVEVKLVDNPELRDRKVLSQVIDYAGAFVDRTDEELTMIFSGRSENGETWEQLIESFFPNQQNVETLSARILRRLQRGEVNMVVACDKAPPGLSKFISGISRQSALPFSLMLAEITPYASPDDQNLTAIFVSRATLKTEIVSRTAVTVSFEQGSNERPSVRVETTPIEEIEQTIAAGDESRLWTETEIEEAAMSSTDSVVRSLFELAKTESNAQQIMSPGKKQTATFGFYLRGIDSNGVEKTKQVFNYRIGDPTLRIYLNMLETIVSEEKYHQFVIRLKDIFPKPMGRDLREPYIPLKEVQEHFDEFRDAILGLMN